MLGSLCRSLAGATLVSWLLLSVARAAPGAGGEVVPDERGRWVSVRAEYRVESIFIDPLDVNGTEVQGTVWTEQRGRFDLALKHPKFGGVVLKLDLLDGVLFGDNGEFGSDPEPTSGLAVASKRPNTAGWHVGLRKGAEDPLDYDNYVPVLRGLDPLRVTHLYGEALLPIGLLRVGRMPMNIGAGIAAHDGERRNRWGVSRYPDIADRLLFGTKLDEAIKLLADPDHELDPSMERGVILAATYDWNVQDSIGAASDDTWQTNVILGWYLDQFRLFGIPWHDFVLSATVSYKHGSSFDTDIVALPLRFETYIGDAYLRLLVSIITGHTREVSEGLAVLSGTTPTVQELDQLGAHFLFEYPVGPIDLALELDYASGDADPRSSNALTGYSFARDWNVGLLLFEHILAFQTARAAAVGIENLKQLDSTSFPLTEIASEGRVQNAALIFPQLTAHILRSPEQSLHARLGVLVAFSAADVVDPIATTLAEDGYEISDDAVNWYGGKPARYYGTEIDLQLAWNLHDLFHWVIEGAALIPGPALYDINGEAVPSFMVENRFLFTF